MRASLFNASNTRLSFSDTVTYISQAVSCINASINSQPADLNICGGSNAVFSVNAQGTSNSYQWQVSTNGGASFTDLPGDTLPTLTINNVNTSFNNYKYRVQITNPCPSNVTSEAAILTVSQPAFITVQPVAQTLCAGLNSTFGITAGGGVTGYHWQVSTNGGTSFTDIPGATASTYTLSGVSASSNGNIYRVRITACNDLTSDNAALTVLIPPSINTAPQSVTVCTGNGHTFSVAAAGSGLTYQWQISTNGGTSFSDIPGAITAGYDVGSVNSSLDGNQYRVVVNGTCPSPVISPAATLLVGAALNITDQPDDVTICAGEDASISITATGAVSYQWQVSTNGGTTFSDLPGANGSTLVLPAVTSSLQGNVYRVVISSCSGDVNSGLADLTVTNPVNISAQPEDKAACVGSNTSISVSATGSGITYQWQVSSDGGNFYTDISGANGASLNLNSITPGQNNNRYRVIIVPAAPCGPQISDFSVLTVNELPEVTATASPNDSICTGSQLILSGEGATSYTWNQGVNNNTAFTPASSGTYTVTGTDANGCTATDIIEITLKPVPSVSITAAPRTSLLPGDSTVLTATANPATSTFNWFRNNVLIPGATSNTIIVRSTDIGSYRAVATNEFDCSASSNIIDVKDSVKTNVFIYPNPNPGEFTVRLPAGNNDGSYVVTVYDSKGARVYAQTRAFTGREASMDLRKLASGIYMLRVWNVSNKEVRTGKVAILR
jgi:hypothetical protein